MALSSFLVVLGGRERWGAGIAAAGAMGAAEDTDSWSGHGGVVGGALEDGHQAGDDDEERPARPQERMLKESSRKRTPMRSDPDGAAKRAEEPELVAGGAVVGEAGAGVGHLADEEPDAEADEEERNDRWMGKCGTGRRCREEEAAKSDEPDGACGKTVTREGLRFGIEPGRRVLRRAEGWGRQGVVAVQGVLQLVVGVWG